MVLILSLTESANSREEGVLGLNIVWIGIKSDNSGRRPGHIYGRSDSSKLFHPDPAFITRMKISLDCLPFKGNNLCWLSTRS